MVEVTVKAYASLRELLGFKTLKIEVGARNIRELIATIGEEYNPSFPSSIIEKETGKVKRAYKVLLNGRDIDHLEGLETRIANGDTIVFFPPVGGG
jgi:molybdopterin synthase sulfur carrier subunit